jgi:tetratricopeptide (TPR) repeat protein
MQPEDISQPLREEYNRNYETAFDILSKHALIHKNSKGRLGFFGKKQLKKAVTLLSRCIEIWRDSWAAMWGLGKAHQALGHHNTALGWFERALKIETNNPDIYREASLEAMSLGNAEQALIYAKKAYNLTPEKPGLLSNMALALLLNKRGDEALKAAEKSCERAPDDEINKRVLKLVQDIVGGKQAYPDKFDPF